MSTQSLILTLAFDLSPIQMCTVQLAVPCEQGKQFKAFAKKNLQHCTIILARQALSSPSLIQHMQVIDYQVDIYFDSDLLQSCS
ncbi:uncharacterized protein PHALS_14559 [Plasmopara halstedii]|uniref:Uncharacterized protein n=1 Tax=Plasmopara halstedii TaxID=4781 RepID=A0A0P1AUG3_PLAHL|nr:uncharacterized protein PHALS_14559 [Plasmopara halstedii]CEG44897.1 hypothetical protein PHALS_14559 [Plasmopara halstedii]|eukprot:XP_024581266.1 hypothetical protein PHALS_14559 [Plasmopara halstedii]